MADTQTANSKKTVSAKVIVDNLRYGKDTPKKGETINVTEDQAKVLRKHKFIE